MFTSVDDIEKQSFLPSSSKQASNSSTFTLKAHPVATNSLKYFLISALTLAFLLTFWHKQTSTTTALQESSINAKLTRMLTHLTHTIHSTRHDMHQHQLNAKYWEGVASGLSQRQNTTTDNFVSKNDPSHQRTIREVLDDVKKDVIESTKSTIETLTHALRIDHLRVSDHDKELTAAKLIEVAVTFEIAAEKLNAEAREVAGRTVAEKLEHDTVIAQVMADPEVTSEMVDAFSPVNTRLEIAAADKE